ncbi:acetyltransferase [Acinetobacter baumannii]|uniref:acetyltransferase n=1 Tax=Acinetobacter baumannii TaxID=470 RepID=UPI002AD9B4D3|nr:acetyltransferase [Acinetobacter baumannii]
MNDSFSCPQNPDVESFLLSKDKGIRFENTSISRTYLIVDDDTGDILAYFSISFKEITLNTDNISKSLIKHLDGINKRAETLKVYLIGQIGKNFSVNNNPIKLENILNEIYNVISQAQALVGGRVIILECENQPKLIALYERHGFNLIDTISGNDTLLTMYTSITQA